MGGMKWDSPFDHWMLPLFFAMFCTIYLLGRFVVFRKWIVEQQLDASSCLISLAHGPLAASLALSTLITHDNDFSSRNSSYQNFVLDYSIAYFTTDLLHYLIFIPGDLLFIGHHLATLFVFVTCRYVAQHGAFSLLVLLLLAEVTSLFQNVWTLAGIRKGDLPFAARVYKFLSPPFYVLYTLMRMVAGPLFFFKMSAFYLSGGAVGAIPRWMCISWIVVVGVAITVSILWIYNHWIEWFRERNMSLEKKDR